MRVLCRRALQSLAVTQPPRALLDFSMQVETWEFLLSYQEQICTGVTSAQVTQSLDRPCWNTLQSLMVGLGKSQRTRFLFTLMKEKCSAELQPLVPAALPFWNQPVPLLWRETNALKAEGRSSLPQTPEGTRNSSFFSAIWEWLSLNLIHCLLCLKKYSSHKSIM